MYGTGMKLSTWKASRPSVSATTKKVTAVAGSASAAYSAQRAVVLKSAYAAQRAGRIIRVCYGDETKPSRQCWVCWPRDEMMKGGGGGVDQVSICRVLKRACGG